MPEIDEHDAEAFGLKLDPDQRDLLYGQRRLAMVAQVLPDPQPYVVEGSRVPFWSCLPETHRPKRVVVPTVVEVAEDEIVQHPLTELGIEHHARRNGWDVLPSLPVFAQDMAAVALGQTCGCLERHADLSCGCLDWGETQLEVISPYACVPITEEEAREIGKVASRTLPAGAFAPLAEIAEITNGIISASEVLEGRYDVEVAELVDAIESGEADENDIEELAMQPAFEAVGWKPPEHLHVAPNGIGYVVPDGMQDKVERLAGLHQRNWRQLQRLLKRDPAAMVSQAFAQFAYPCMDQCDVHEMFSAPAKGRARLD